MIYMHATLDITRYGIGMHLPYRTVPYRTVMYSRSIESFIGRTVANTREIMKPLDSNPR
jgi:uncharacterized protein YwlG (UPF0340 family)